MTAKLGSEGRELKLKAANALKIPAHGLDDANPFDPGNQHSQDQLISEWIREHHPQQASDLIQQAGVTLSLAAQAVADGNAAMDQEVWRELKEKDPGWVASRRQAAQNRMAADLEKAASEAIDRGAAQRQSIRRTNNGLNVEQHCNDWNRRHQGMGHLPARRLIP